MSIGHVNNRAYMREQNVLVDRCQFLHDGIIVSPAFWVAREVGEVLTGPGIILLKPRFGEDLLVDPGDVGVESELQLDRWISGATFWYM